MLTFFSVVRAAVQIAKKLRKLKIKNARRTSNKQHEDTMNRLTALTLGTCILNGFSLLLLAFAAIFNVLSTTFELAKYRSGAEIVQKIYNMYLIIPQYFMVIMGSNIGFIVHCYYSKMYRQAMWETFAATKASIKRFAHKCGANGAANVVQPVEFKIKSVKSVSKEVTLIQSQM